MPSLESCYFCHRQLFVVCTIALDLRPYQLKWVEFTMADQQPDNIMTIYILSNGDVSYVLRGRVAYFDEYRNSSAFKDFLS